MKRHYSNTDILWIHANCKCSANEGNTELARKAKNKLKTIWNSLNNGDTDVQDINVLYNKLKSAINIVNHCDAKDYDRGRITNG